MDGTTLSSSGLAGVLAAAAPIVVAAVGETFAERAGVINLSVNGTILLSAMGGFVVAVTTGQPGTRDSSRGGDRGAGRPDGGFRQHHPAPVTGGGGLRAGPVLPRPLLLPGQSLHGRAGAPARRCAPSLVCSDIPVLGTLFFRQDFMTYFSFVLIVVAWWWIFRTRPGLVLRAVGERPEAAFARGARVNLIRYVYTTLGGALVGLAGPMFSLSVKAGWKGTISGLDGLGWIVLAIVIFGAWNPVRVALGAYLFGLLQWLSVVLQPSLQGNTVPGPAGSTLPPHDPHPPPGQHRQRRVGGARAGRFARTLAAGGRAHLPRPPRRPTSEPRGAVRARLGRGWTCV